MSRTIKFDFKFGDYEKNEYELGILDFSGGFLLVHSKLGNKTDVFPLGNISSWEIIENGN